MTPWMVTRRAFVCGGVANLVAAPARASAEKVRLRRLYKRDRSPSRVAERLQGQRVVVRGYMAPPLRAETRFFVLTRRPMLVCPFCEAASDWPDDILAVYTKRRVRVKAFDVGIAVTGTLELGEFLDEDTGFVSLARLEDATYR